MSENGEETRNIAPLLEEYATPTYSSFPVEGGEQDKPLAPTRARFRIQPKTVRDRWSASEDELLALLASKQNMNWSQIAARFPNKSTHQVIDRWEKVIDPALVKGSWTREEDEEIINWVHTKGPTNWTKLAESMPGRIGKQCRERWHNGLNPDVIKTPWTPQEDAIILKFQGQWGNKWSKISQCLPGRTDNAIKNRWNSTLKRRAKVKAPPLPRQSSTPITGFDDLNSTHIDPSQLLTISQIPIDLFPPEPDNILLYDPNLPLSNSSPDPMNDETFYPENSKLSFID